MECHGSVDSAKSELVCSSIMMGAERVPQHRMDKTDKNSQCLETYDAMHKTTESERKVMKKLLGLAIIRLIKFYATALHKAAPKVELIAEDRSMSTWVAKSLPQHPWVTHKLMYRVCSSCKNLSWNLIP